MEAVPNGNAAGGVGTRDNYLELRSMVLLIGMGSAEHNARNPVNGSSFFLNLNTLSS